MARKFGVAVVVRRGERLLVIERSKFVSAPGRFCFPGGCIESGESEDQTVVRELQEELAVTVEPMGRLWRSVTPWGVDLAWWQASMSADQTPVALPAEVAAWHWLTPAEMSALDALLDSNRDFLAALSQGVFALQ